VTPNSAHPSGLVSVWRPAALLAGLLCCVYLISYTGAFRVDDEHILAARAQSLALRGRAEEPQVYGNSRARALVTMGDQATQVEPLQTVLGAALYRLGRVAGLGGAQSLLTLNLYLTALTGAVVFLTVVALGLGRRVGIWCALLFGLATMAWPYASTFTVSSRLVVALPLRMVASSCLVFSIALCIRSLACFVTSGRLLIGRECRRAHPGAHGRWHRAG